MIQLSEQWQDGKFKCFKKTIGGRRFYFTNDRKASERMAMALMAAWSQLEASGAGWNDQAVADALALAGVRDERREAAKAKRNERLHAAIDVYLTDYKAKVGVRRYQRAHDALAAYKRYQKDIPLRGVTWDVLSEAVNHYRSRPKTARGTTMAVDTVKEQLKAIRMFYDWADLSERWEAPRRFERLFKVNATALKTAAELREDGSGQDVFTVAELAVVWAAAPRRLRLYMGLALNTGETAQGLADLLKSDLRRDGDGLVIDRNRAKTGVRGVYPLWPEVAELVEAEMDRNEVEPLLFKSADGRPLVWCQDTWRVDSVGKAWKKLLRTCEGVGPLPFKFLRKTGASIVQQLSGSLDVAKLYLSHSGGSVAERHYLAKNFERLADALGLMRQHLAPVFDPAAAVGELRAA